MNQNKNKSKSDNESNSFPPNKGQYETFCLSEHEYLQLKHKIDEYNSRVIFYKSKFDTIIGIIYGLFGIISFFVLVYGFLGESGFLKKILTYGLIFISILFLVFINMLSDLPDKLAKRRVDRLKIKPSEEDLQKFNDYEKAFKVYQKSISEYWYSRTGWEFEGEFEVLLNNQGFITNKTRGSSDGGIDIFAVKNDISYAVQCKAHKNPVGPAIVRELYGSMNHNNIENGILVNLGGFTKGVFEFSKDKSIILLDIDDVIKLHEGQKSI